ncbi:MAG: endopeptidase [Thermoleophilaceae bacterium]|nr:endopeptidase [Thermoleophilaceae bacterium]
MAVGIAVVAAGAATFALRPRSELVQPAPVAATDYFSASQLDRIHDYTGTQRLLGLGGLALSTGTLALIALRPPRRVRRALERGGARPILGAAAAGGALSLVLVVVGLPLGAVAEQRARDFGLSTQDWGGWFGDLAKSAGIGAVFAALGGALLMALIRRFPRSWWALGAVATVVFSAVFVSYGPVVIDPLFNKFTKLPNSPLRNEVLALSHKDGVDVGEVYRVDASRRTTGANAYVNGIGHTKRVVLYDNLLKDFSPDQVRSVVAHELGHVKHRDVPRGLLWLAIVAPAGMLVIQRLTERLAPDAARGRDAGPVVVPAAALSIALVAFLLNIPGNALSRQVERSADGHALDLDRDPAAFIAVERKLTLQNLGDPDPPGWLQVIFGTHPKTVDRIGYALTWARKN